MSARFDYKSTKSMDIRDQVKVKRLPGGSVEDCEVIAGEVFTGRVMRVGMPLNIPKPRLLLIRDSLCFPRSDKLVSMENLDIQTEEYVKNVVDKLLSFEPDVILAQNVVCQEIIDALYAKGGISLILRVKHQVLERVRRLFNVGIIESLDSTTESPFNNQTGICTGFTNKSVILQHESLSCRKSLIILERSGLEKGCTILLRGGDTSELGKVKRILLRMLLVMINAKFEKSFLLTEYSQTANFQEDIIRRFSDEGARFSSMTLSPFVQIPTPNDKLDNDEAPEEPKKNQEQVQDQNQEGYQHPELVTAILTSGLEDRKVRNMLADYRRRSSSKYSRNKPRRQIEHQDKLPKDNKIPYYFRALESKPLPLVYSSHSPISKMSPHYCVRPWVASMFFYGELDMPIGTFLEAFCFGFEEKCPNR